MKSWKLLESSERKPPDPNKDLRNWGFPAGPWFWEPEDHKPEDPDERVRIEAQGGIVARQRVWPRQHSAIWRWHGIWIVPVSGLKRIRHDGIMCYSWDIMGYCIWMEFLCDNGITSANNLRYQCLIISIMVNEWTSLGYWPLTFCLLTGYDGREHDETCSSLYGI